MPLILAKNTKAEEAEGAAAAGDHLVVALAVSTMITTMMMNITINNLLKKMRRMMNNINIWTPATQQLKSASKST